MSNPYSEAGRLLLAYTEPAPPPLGYSRAPLLGLGGELWRMACRDGALVLEKAGRRSKPSPGQLSLFSPAADASPGGGRNIGRTKTVNGKTYRLNANSRWERADKPKQGRQSGGSQRLQVIADDAIAPSTRPSKVAQPKRKLRSVAEKQSAIADIKAQFIESGMSAEFAQTSAELIDAQNNGETLSSAQQDYLKMAMAEARKNPAADPPVEAATPSWHQDAEYSVLTMDDNRMVRSQKISGQEAAAQGYSELGKVPPAVVEFFNNRISRILARNTAILSARRTDQMFGGGGRYVFELTGGKDSEWEGQGDEEIQAKRKFAAQNGVDFDKLLDELGYEPPLKLSQAEKSWGEGEQDESREVEAEPGADDDAAIASVAPSTVLAGLESLADEHGNYIPMPEFRKLPEVAGLPREQQDQLLADLEQSGEIETSTLQEVGAWSEEDKAQGIPAPMDSLKFFISLSGGDDLFSGIGEENDGSDAIAEFRRLIQPALSGSVGDVDQYINSRKLSTGISDAQAEQVLREERAALGGGTAIATQPESTSTSTTVESAGSGAKKRQQSLKITSKYHVTATEKKHIKMGLEAGHREWASKRKHYKILGSGDGPEIQVAIYNLPLKDGFGNRVESASLATRQNVATVTGFNPAASTSTTVESDGSSDEFAPPPHSPEFKQQGYSVKPSDIHYYAQDPKTGLHYVTIAGENYSYESPKVGVQKNFRHSDGDNKVVARNYKTFRNKLGIAGGSPAANALTVTLNSSSRQGLAKPAASTSTTVESASPQSEPSPSFEKEYSNAVGNRFMRFRVPHKESSVPIDVKVRDGQGGGSQMSRAEAKAEALAQYQARYDSKESTTPARADKLGFSPQTLLARQDHLRDRQFYAKGVTQLLTALQAGQDVEIYPEERSQYGVKLSAMIDGQAVPITKSKIRTNDLRFYGITPPAKLAKSVADWPTLALDGVRYALNPESLILQRI